DTAVVFPHDVCIHRLFENQVLRTPNAVAVRFGDRHLTYRQLNEQANRLAEHLHKLGTRPDTIVSVHLDRSPDLIVALLAVLKAGGAYLPLDASYPRQRLGFLLADARCRLILTKESLVEALPEQPGEVLCIDRDGVAWSRASSEDFVSAVTS